MFSIFEDDVSNGLSKLNYEYLQEIRIRNNKPVIVRYHNRQYFLTKNGVSGVVDNSIIASKNEVEKIILKASNYSPYAINDMLKNGFIPLKYGARIGVCGEWVENSGKITSVKNFSSISFRIPHEVKGCSKELIDFLETNESFDSLLIISGPGNGKTTLIRDLSRVYSISNNVIIIDERYEISASYNGEPCCDVGFSDVICGVNKGLGIEMAIRSMNPDIVVTDEISELDLISLHYAKTCGVKIITTTHASSIDQLMAKKGYDKIFQEKTFSHYVVLSDKYLGKIDSIYNDRLERVW